MTSTLTIPATGEHAFVARATKCAHQDAPACRRRVLISAYAMSPVRGSEPGMGWNIASRLARHHDVTVICSSQVPPMAEDFRGEIETHLRANGPIPGLSFHFVDPPLLSYLTQRETPLMRRTLYYAGYRSWQRAAFRAASELHAREPFDIVHQLNITGFREPGYLWKLPNVPFVWGPVGGAANIPAPFLPMMGGLRERLFYRLRNVTNAMQKRTKLRCKAAARRASHIWVVGDANRRMVEDVWGCEAEPMLEVGGEPHPMGRVHTFDPAENRPLNLVWSGQHIGRKALPILIHALALLGGKPAIKLTVLGDGPETSAWKALVSELKLTDRVTWTGRIPRDQAIARMASADAFATSSVLEETSLVVLEALSLGLPVITHDACGMGVAVTDDCGIKVPMRTPAESIAGFAAALKSLATAGGERFEALSRGALARAKELGWDDKAAAIAGTYERVVARYAPHAHAGRSAS